MKLDIGLAKGKKQHDKRATVKDRDWKRQQGRILKSSNLKKYYPCNECSLSMEGRIHF